jgi:hypothetical protein
MKNPEGGVCEFLERRPGSAANERAAIMVFYGRKTLG